MQPKKKSHKHTWRVYGVSICPPRILLECKCGKDTARKPKSQVEWNKSFAVQDTEVNQ